MRWKARVCTLTGRPLRLRTRPCVHRVLQRSPGKASARTKKMVIMRMSKTMRTRQKLLQLLRLQWIQSRCVLCWRGYSWALHLAVVAVVVPLVVQSIHYRNRIEGI